MRSTHIFHYSILFFFYHKVKWVNNTFAWKILYFIVVKETSINTAFLET